MNQLRGEAWIQSVQKRRMDIMLGLGMLPAAMPVCLGAAALIKTVDGFSPWFTQERNGWRGQSFFIRKLRSMPPDTEQNHGAYFNDPRATALGKVLRNTRIDELPQIINVMKGDMSFVGPRPLIMDLYLEILEFLSPSERKEWARARSICRPGIVDAYNVAVCDGHDLKPVERVEYDMQYLEIASYDVDKEALLKCARVMGRILTNPLQRPHSVSVVESIPDQTVALPDLAA